MSEPRTLYVIPQLHTRDNSTTTYLKNCISVGVIVPATDDDLKAALIDGMTVADWLELGIALSADGPNWMEPDAQVKFADRVQARVLAALGGTDVR